MMQEKRLQWRIEDMEQRNLENARVLWLRFVEKNRRDVEEKTEQLKAISNLAALFAGFAVVTLTQFAIDDSTNSADYSFWNEPSTVVSDCCSTPPKFFVSAIRTTLLMSMTRC
jgi:hypothetical protein